MLKTLVHPIVLTTALLSPFAAVAAPPGDDDLAALSDDFNDPKTLTNWLRVYREERMGADQLERFDIGRTKTGWMTLMPYTSVWYQNWRGLLVHKRVRGDFVVTTHVRATGRTGDRPPASQFSLAGIMVRTPRNVTPQTWRPGGENYLFLSLGAANTPGSSSTASASPGKWRRPARCRGNVGLEIERSLRAVYERFSRQCGFQHASRPQATMRFRSNLARPIRSAFS